MSEVVQIADRKLKLVARFDDSKLVHNELATGIGYSWKFNEQTDTGET